MYAVSPESGLTACGDPHTSQSVAVHLILLNQALALLMLHNQPYLSAWSDIKISLSRLQVWHPNPISLDRLPETKHVLRNYYCLWRFCWFHFLIWYVYCMYVCMHVCMHACICMYVWRWINRKVTKNKTKIIWLLDVFTNSRGTASVKKSTKNLSCLLLFIVFVPSFFFLFFFCCCCTFCFTVSILLGGRSGQWTYVWSSLILVDFCMVNYDWWAVANLCLIFLIH